MQYIVFMYQITSQRDDVKYLLPFSTAKHFSSQIALEKAIRPWQLSMN